MEKKKKKEEMMEPAGPFSWLHKQILNNAKSDKG